MTRICKILKIEIFYEQSPFLTRKKLKIKEFVASIFQLTIILTKFGKINLYYRLCMKKDLFVNVLLRILATFAASGLGVIGAGTIAGVPVLKAVFMAGIAGVAVVVEGLSRAFLEDGRLTTSEINEVFNKVDKKSPKIKTTSE